ncbi:unannotated protein [freshwater metagenome]|uniref:Unannotated protein n=1 Tax=freshwater metagenome TaxID=449393 RepID=A0A6J7DZR0_9ZZZZ
MTLPLANTYYYKYEFTVCHGLSLSQSVENFKF